MITILQRWLLWISCCGMLVACGTPDQPHLNQAQPVEQTPATVLAHSFASPVPSSTPPTATATLTDRQIGATDEAAWDQARTSEAIYNATWEAEVATSAALVDNGLVPSPTPEPRVPITPVPTWENGFDPHTWNCWVGELEARDPFYMQQCWRGMINGVWYQLEPGWAETYETVQTSAAPEQLRSALQLSRWRYGTYRYSGEEEIVYTAPITEGALSLVQISGAVLLLETQQGSQLSFNVETREWGDAVAVPTWTLTPLPTATPLPSATPTPTDGSLRINVGGGAQTINGVTWQADAFFTGGQAASSGEIVSIGNTSADALYLDERSGGGNGTSFSYAIPVPQSGTYRVRLHFAELYWGAPSGGPGHAGKRVFDVSLEQGAATHRSVDLYAEAGVGNAFVLENVLAVSDGTLNLQFTGLVDAPTLAAIEIIPTTDAVPAATPTSGSGGSSPILSYTLINADTDMPIPGYDPIAGDQLTVKLSSLPTRRLNIRANLQGKGGVEVAGVQWQLDGAYYTTDSSAPYAFSGSIDQPNGSTDYGVWEPAPGSYTIRGRPYSILYSVLPDGTPTQTRTFHHPRDLRLNLK